MTTSIDTIGLSSTASLNQPDISRLTTKSVEGTGVFDVLMSAVKQHLLEEYEANRVTGEEYTQVYLGALQGAMQTAVQFLLNSQQEEKLQAEIAYTRQKTVTELTQTDDSIPAGLGFNGDTAIEGLVALQKDKLTLEGDLVSSQVSRSEAEVALTGQKVISELSQTDDDFTQAITSGYGFNVTPSLLGMLKAAKDKAAAEAAYTDQKVLTEIAITDKAVAETAHIVQSTTTELAMKDKVVAETAYTEQRTVTELASTSDTKPSDLGEASTTEITGLVSIQKDKLTAETTYIDQKIVTEVTAKDKLLSEISYTDQKIVTELANKDRVIAETAYTEQKTVTELASTSDIKPAGLGEIIDSTSITGLISAQKNKVNAETAFTDQRTATELVEKDRIIAETSKATAETAFTTQRTTTEVAETDRVLAETDKTIATKSKVDAETVFTEQRTVTELASTSSTKPADLGEMTGTTAITGTIFAQKTKMEAEAVLLAQKANTELAQTADSVEVGSPYLNSSTTVTGVIDKQKSLYGAQTEGFSRDAEQKLLKIMTDAWSVAATQSLTDLNDNNHLTDSSLGEVVNKAKSGIGITT